MGWHYNRFPAYVSVAERKKKIENQRKKFDKNKDIEPIVIQGRSITKSFWGKAWCNNIESYRDYAYRLDRGRSYVRHGAVVDLKIKTGLVEAVVCGSSTYTVKITITPTAPAQWQTLLQKCAGKIGSLVELLQGKLSENIMKIIADANNGLFPTNKEISFKCSCPDVASVCKHVAAVMYGIGARIDTDPEKLFVLRSVNHTELFMHAMQNPNLSSKTAQPASKIDGDLSQIFGIEIGTENKGSKNSPVAVSNPAKVKKSSSFANPLRQSSSVARTSSDKTAAWAIAEGDGSTDMTADRAQKVETQKAKPSTHKKSTLKKQQTVAKKKATPKKKTTTQRKTTVKSKKKTKLRKKAEA